MALCELCILAFNDIYEMDHSLASLASLIAKERDAARSRGETCLLLVAGDFLACGSSIDCVRQSKGLGMVHVLNQMNVDMVVCGNHEFDFGVENLEQAIETSSFPWLGSNVDCKGCLFTKTIDVKGCKLGFFGLCTSHGLPPSHSLRIRKPVEAARQAVAHLRDVEKTNCVIGLTHLPIEDDKSVCRQVQGIGLVLGGHDHHALSTEERGTHIIKAGCNSRYLTRVRATVSGDDLRVKEWALLANAGQDKDTVLDGIICAFHDPASKTRPANTMKGIFLEQDLDSRFVRERRSSMAVWIADNILAHFHSKGFKADLCLLHAGTVRGQRLYPKGHFFNEQDLKRELPYDTRLCVLEMSGDTLCTAIEQAISFVANTPMASFPHLSRGWSFDCDLARKQGHRLSSVHLSDGTSVDRSHRYLVIVPTRLAQSSDGYTALLDASLVEGSEVRMHEIDHLCCHD